LLLVFFRFRRSRWGPKYRLWEKKKQQQSFPYVVSLSEREKKNRLVCWNGKLANEGLCVRGSVISLEEGALVLLLVVVPAMMTTMAVAVLLHALDEGCVFQ